MDSWLYGDDGDSADSGIPGRMALTDSGVPACTEMMRLRHVLPLTLDSYRSPREISDLGRRGHRWFPISDILTVRVRVALIFGVLAVSPLRVARLMKSMQ